jgi:PEP-CTERM motif
MKRLLLTAAATAALLATTAAQAGPFILSGTDADDHGGTNGIVNQTGWLYMQKALENMAPAVTNGNKVVTILGSTSSALDAATSAFSKSSLAGPGGWTFNTVSVADFGTFFGAGGTLGNSGLLMMDSGANISGGVVGTNFTAHATAINNFIGAGGGLFSQANGFQWLSALLPTITFTDIGTGGNSNPLAMTAAGTAAFPGLTNNDLSAGPWHGSFNNIGALTELADSPARSGWAGRDNVIIGGRTGSITNPVPEPASLALVSLALAAAGFAAKRKRA